MGITASMALKLETFKKRLKMSNYLLLFILLGSTNAAPQPDAAPDPEPDADAYGDNYGAPVISSNTSPVIDSGVGGGSSWGGSSGGSWGGGSSCQTSNECCGIAEKCYGYSNCGVAPAPNPGPICCNIWKYQCAGGAVDQVTKIQKMKKHCVQVPVPNCRMTTETITRQVQGQHCVPVPLTQRFTWTKKIANCDQWSQGSAHITVRSDTVVPGEHQIKKFCLQVKTFTCKKVIRNKSDSKTVKIPKKVSYTVQKCRNMRIPGVPTTKTITRTKYKKVCYEVPVKPTCTQTPCTFGGSCGQNQSPCSLTESTNVSPCQQAQPQPLYRKKREADPNYGQVINPTQGGWDGSDGIGTIDGGYGQGGVIDGVASGGVIDGGASGGVIDGGASWGGSENEGSWGGPDVRDAGCGSYQQPTCSGQAGGGCVSGMQQCCEMKTKTRRVCKKVPYQVQEVVTIPSRGQWKKVCNPVTKYKFTYETKVITGNGKITNTKCFPTWKQTCVQLRVPTYRVTPDTSGKSVTYKTQSCRVSTTIVTFTKTFPDGDVRCEHKTMPKQIQVTRKVCDGSTSKQYCFNVPYADGKIIPGQGGKCWWTPTKKCMEQPTCDTPPDPMCGRCDTFRKNDGYSSCSTNTCGSYIPGGDHGDGGSWGGGDGGNWDGGEGGLDVGGNMLDAGAIGGGGNVISGGYGTLTEVEDGMGDVSSLVQEKVMDDVNNLVEEQVEDKMESLVN